MVKSAPHLDPVSLFNRLHRLEEVFAAVSVRFCLNERVRSRVTPKYFGNLLKSILVLPLSLSVDLSYMECAAHRLICIRL